MTGYTQPDNIPYPDDYLADADSPATMQSLAEATQTALSARSGTAHTHNYAPNPHAHDYAPTVHTHSYSPTGHTHPYSPDTHTHEPSGAGFRWGSVTFSSVSPDSESVTGVLPKNSNEWIFLQVVHPSAYLFASLVDVTANNFKIKLRNSTNNTTHTNITVWYLLVKVS